MGEVEDKSYAISFKLNSNLNFNCFYVILSEEAVYKLQRQNFCSKYEVISQIPVWFFIFTK